MTVNVHYALDYFVTNIKMLCDFLCVGGVMYWNVSVVLSSCKIVMSKKNAKLGLKPTHVRN